MILNKIPAMAWLLGSVTAFALGDLLSKKVVMAPSVPLFLWMLASYLTGSLLWLPALSLRKDLSTTGAMWSMLAILATAGTGVFYYGEKMPAKNVAGLVLALVAIYLSH